MGHYKRNTAIVVLALLALLVSVAACTRQHARRAARKRAQAEKAKVTAIEVALGALPVRYYQEGSECKPPAVAGVHIKPSLPIEPRVSLPVRPLHYSGQGHPASTLLHLRLLRRVWLDGWTVA